MSNPTEIFAERLAAQTRQHDATDPRLIAAHFTAGWLAAVDALNVRNLLADLAPAPQSAPDADAEGWFTHNPGDPMPCAGDLLVDVVFADGACSMSVRAFRWSEGPYDWWVCPKHDGNQIVKWRPTAL
jgi:hypothetical protein